MHIFETTVSREERADFHYFLRTQGFRKFDLPLDRITYEQDGTGIKECYWVKLVFECDEDATAYRLKNLEVVYHQNKPYYVDLNTDFEEELMSKYGEAPGEK